MSPGRGDEVKRPNLWGFLFGDLAAAKGWEKLRKAATGPVDTAWVAITSVPTRTDQRQHRLKGALAAARYQGRELDQW